MLHLERFVDLFRVVKQAIYVSQKSYSIKEIEKYYSFERSGDVRKGDVFLFINSKSFLN